MCLADFIDLDGEDWIGGFAVAIHGIEPHLARFKAGNDDYSDILLKALADRLAEAFAERMHGHVRERVWGYAGAERLTNAELIRENYAGIRPAPSYPACPGHSLKPTLFEMLGGAARDADRGSGAPAAAQPRLEDIQGIAARPVPFRAGILLTAFPPRQAPRRTSSAGNGSQIPHRFGFRLPRRRCRAVIRAGAWRGSYPGALE